MPTSLPALLMPQPARTSLFATAAFAVLTAVAHSQCATQWLPGPPLAGCDLTVVAATEWDPDGVGPRAPVVVLGGGFTTAGDVAANHVVTFDPATSTWSTLGSGIVGAFGFAAIRVFALVVLPNGDLVAGGAFTTAGGVPASCIARWDGVAWSPLGSGMNGAVRALRVLPNGDLVAGGDFTIAGGVPVQEVARWNGLAWSPFGSGPGTSFDNVVFALAVLPNGELIAADNVSFAGSPATNPIVRWTGTAWSPVGTGITGLASALATLSNGDLVAGGLLDIGVGTGAQGVVRWNGTAWSLFGSSLPREVTALCPLANGDVVAVAKDGRIYRGNGTTWSAIGTTSYPGYGVAAVQLGSGTFVVGGTFETIDGVSVGNVGAWNGTTWSPLGAPARVGATSAATWMPGGEIVVAERAFSGVLPITRLQRWNGSSWSQLGGDVDAIVNGLSTAANGDLLAWGTFSAIGNASIARVARWNGGAWQPLGTGTNFWVNTVLELSNGDVVAAGAFDLAGGVAVNNIARWDGAAWSPVGSGLSGEVSALAEAANGDLLASAGNGPSSVMRWNGTVWSAVGALVGRAKALAVLPNGDIVAAGMGQVSRWNGTAWLPLGGGFGPFSQVNGVVALPAGDVIAVGSFATAGGVPAHGAARWDGASWTPLAAGSTGFPQSLARAPNGDLVLSGVSCMDGVVSSGFARLTTTCPATVGTTGPGCDGDTLTATNLPWTGAVFGARASGLPATAIALDVLGFTTASIPLVSVLPQGGAGCALAVGPDSVAALVPSGGVVATQLVIPNSVVFAGVVVHEQVLALGLDASGAVTTFTGTNRLTLTIGSY